MLDNPDQVILWQYDIIKINATLAFTWVVMALLAGGSYMITRRLSVDAPISRGQNLLEVIVSYSNRQIHEISQQEPERYLPFIGSLFLFIFFVQSAGSGSRLHAADRIAFDHNGSGTECLYCRSLLWHPSGRIMGIC